MTEDQLRIAATAAHFDLFTAEGRGRSHQALVDLFIGMQEFIRPKTFLEVGAFDARFSRMARERHPSAKVIAFEASPDSHPHHRGNFDCAGARIDYQQPAVSDEVGTISFQIQTRRSGVEAPRVKGDDSLLKRTVSEQHPLYQDVEYETVTVNTVTLDAFLADAMFATDDFSCWIDVEGASEKVFGGAASIVPRMQSIFIEVEEKPHWSGQWMFSDVERFLNANGFRAVARDFEFEHQFNVVFVHDRVTRHYGFSQHMVRYLNRIGRNLP